jgi:hypothetical protein
MNAIKIRATAVAMETETPLSVQSKPKRSPAHVRAIMAYLAMRKERAYRLELIKKLESAVDYQKQLLTERNNFEAAYKTMTDQARILWDQKAKCAADSKRDRLALEQTTKFWRSKVRKAKIAKTQLTKMLREAERQCLLWEVEVKNGVAGASDQLSKWEAEYSQIEKFL